MNSERYPVLITNIGNLRVQSVLDNGFIQSSEVAPEVHSHAFYELLITTEGAIGIDIYSRSTLNEVYTVKKGSACILPSGTYHCTRALTPDTEKLALRFCCIPSANPKVNDSALALYNRSLYKCSTPTVNLIYDYVDKEKRIGALALQGTLSGLAGFFTTLLLTPLVDRIQNNGNRLFGIHVYAQQILSAIAAVIVAILILYLNLVVKRIKREK